MSEQERTCGGACCAAFPLGNGHPAFRKAPKGQMKFIAEMVIPLTRRQALRRSRRFGYPDPPQYPAGWQWYTCRHWDEKSRLCTVYDQRPDMCRDYPYREKECERGCGYKLTQKDYQQQAERDDSPWVWDATEKGWRPRSTSKEVWDARKRIMRARKKVA